jgi:hypothetical protein
MRGALNLVEWTVASEELLAGWIVAAKKNSGPRRFSVYFWVLLNARVFPSKIFQRSPDFLLIRSANHSGRSFLFLLMTLGQPSDVTTDG